MSDSGTAQARPERTYNRLWSAPRQGRLPGPVSIAAGALVVASLLCASTAAAQPVDVSSDQSPTCEYTLTPPQVVQLPGGASGVSATFAASHCSGIAQPVTVTVCLNTPLRGGECKDNWGWSIAQVVTPAAHLTGTYSTSGRGCWRVGGTEVTCTAAETQTSTF